MVLAAFPDGIPDEAYEPLLVLLGRGMSHRAAATLLAHCTGRDEPTVYNDLLRALSPSPHGGVDPARSEEVGRRLREHGYDLWLAKEE